MYRASPSFATKGSVTVRPVTGQSLKRVPVAVVGGGNAAVKSVLDLKSYASELHLISTTPLTADAILGERLKGLTKLKQYIGHTAVEIKGTKTVERVVIEEFKTKHRIELPVQGVFVEIGLDPNLGFVAQSVESNADREIQIDCFCRTNIPGLFAAGCYLGAGETDHYRRRRRRQGGDQGMGEYLIGQEPEKH